MATTFSRIYNTWLKARDFTPTDAAPILAVSRSVSYEYASGDSLPCKTRIPHIAKTLNVPEEKLRRVLEKDRKAKGA